jgi:arylsulfatase
MKRIKIIITIYACLSAFIFQAQNKPNVIIILADDLGYSDIGCYGGEINTPSLDKLANQGIRLPNMHNASMCVISRSSLLTGNWWPKTGSGIKKGPNLAQELKKVGYRTGIVGKWHLEGEPNNKGFDYFFGFLGGYASYFDGHKSYRLNSDVFNDYGKDYYSTDAFTDRAIDFVSAKDEAGKEEPFFLYLSYQSPHNPLQAPKEDIMKYRGKYLKGWESIRKERLKNQTKLGILNSETPIPEYPKNLPDWDSLTDEQKDLEDLRMSVYAAMVERMDTGIGRLMKTLEETNQAENTLILFLSDNGTDSFSVMDKNLLKRGLLPGDPGSNYQLGTGWAYASVTPWRLYKISQHGGGVKTGAIAWWPKVIKNTGAIKPNAMHVVDIMPTILGTTNYNSSKEGKKFLKSLSGESFITLLEGKDWNRKSPMFFQFMDNRAIRTKEWSLLEVDGSGWELYDVEKDPLETTDLYLRHKKEASKLSEEWMDWWLTYNKKYIPKSTKNNMHYKPQGDRGSGNQYIPSSMPSKLKQHYPIPSN